MKITIKRIKYLLISYILLYIIGLFISMDWNPLYWEILNETFGRLFFVIIFSVFTIIPIIISDL